MLIMYRLRAHWIISEIRIFLALASFCALVMTALYFLTPQPSIGFTLRWLTEATIGLIAIGMLAYLIAAVRWVEFSKDGVTFAVGLRNKKVAWHDLVPPDSPVSFGIRFRYKFNGKVQQSDTLPVTRELACAILSHPQCPHWEMDPKIWKSLRMKTPSKPS